MSHTTPNGKPDGRETYVYRVNAQDEIVWVSENWQAFADANCGAANTAADVVIGRSLWEYIVGLEVRHLYETVLKAVRERGQPIRLLFRCDAPDLRRYLQLLLVPLADRQVEFRSQLLRTETRACVDLLRPEFPRSDGIVTLCSMCKKIATGPNEWREIEEAINHLHLFEQDALPSLSHGLCPVCYEAMMAEIR